MSAIRIIGGQYKGKKIPVYRHVQLRPTPNRVRETLFNWLMHDLPGSVCLDAFAGTGALGLEALSRGAQHVTFIEQHGPTFLHLKQVTATFDRTAITLLHLNCHEFFKHATQPFDIIFLDPPFHSDDLGQCLQILSQANHLKPEGLLYIESPHPLPASTHWHPVRTQHAGQVYYGLFKRT